MPARLGVKGFDLNTWKDGVAFAKVEKELEKEQVEGGGKSGFGVWIHSSLSCSLDFPMGRASRPLPM